MIPITTRSSTRVNPRDRRNRGVLLLSRLLLVRPEKTSIESFDASLLITGVLSIIGNNKGKQKNRKNVIFLTVRSAAGRRSHHWDKAHRLVYSRWPSRLQDARCLRPAS